MAEKIATRNAYGDAIVALAEQYPELVVLDADLSGATMSKGFLPQAARPAATPIMLHSAMPMLKKRSG